jgi:hypothetical protein
MADSSIANLDITTHTFSGLFDKTNQVLELLRTKIVSTEANSTGAVTTGNCIVNGIFTANSLISGNSSVNVSCNSVIIQVSNSTAQVNIQSNSIKIGNTTVNNTIVQVGANVVINSSSTFFGNSTVNSVHTSALLQIANSTSTINIDSSKVVVGISTLNSTAVSVGGNVSLNSSASLIGNSSVNTFVTSSLIQVANSSSSVTIDPSQVTVGISTVNSLAVSVGANLLVNSSTVFVGNSLINSVITSSALNISTFLISNSTVFQVSGTTANLVGTSIFLNGNVTITGITSTIAGNLTISSAKEIDFVDSVGNPSANGGITRNGLDLKYNSNGVIKTIAFLSDIGSELVLGGTPTTITFGDVADGGNTSSNAAAYNHKHGAPLIPVKVWLPAAGSNGVIGFSAYDLPATSNTPTAALFGSDPHSMGVLSFDSFGSATAQFHIHLPSDWSVSSNVSLKYIWHSGSTSVANVIWTASTAAVGDGEDIQNPTFNTQNKVSSPNQTTAFRRNSAIISQANTNGFTAGDLIFFRIGRDPVDDGDTLNVTVSLAGIELTYYRTGS